MKKTRNQKVSISRLKGLSFSEQPEGSLVVDTRDIDKPRFVGVIIRKPFSPFYMLCPFVRKRLYFDLPPPEGFKSPERAENWIAKHAVSWVEKTTYTPLNFLTKYIVSDAPSKIALFHIRLQLTLLYLLVSLFVFSYQPLDPSPVLHFGIKGLAGVFLILGIVNAVMFIKESI